MQTHVFTLSHFLLDDPRIFGQVLLISAYSSCLSFYSFLLNRICTFYLGQLSHTCIMLFTIKDKHEIAQFSLPCFEIMIFLTKTKNDLNKDKLAEEQNENKLLLKIVSEYDQEIPQSQSADKPMAPQRRATLQS